MNVVFCDIIRLCLIIFFFNRFFDLESKEVAGLLASFLAVWFFQIKSLLGIGYTMSAYVSLN